VAWNATQTLNDEEEDKDREEGEVTPPPHSPPHEALPLLGDILSRQAGIVVGARRLNRLQTEVGPSTGLPSQPHLVLVCSDSQGTSIVPVLMKPTHLFRVLQVLLSLPTVRVATNMMAGPSSLGSVGVEPPSKNSHPSSFL
jgi:hypothetical protein